MINNLQKEYHILDLQQRIIREVVLQIELLLNHKRKDICEYQVQDFILNFLHNSLDNNYFQVSKEKYGKYDIVIEQDNKPLFLFELKTFIKNNEKMQKNTNYKKILKDIQKLEDGINKYQCRSYFILVCKEKDLDNKHSEFDFVINRLQNIKKWHKINNIKLRPSRKDKVFRTYAFSWEIKL